MAPSDAATRPGPASELDEDRQKSLLRLVLCGSVDDGKSTLLGRLLYESRMILDDQLVALAADSARFGTQGSELDLALLVDGLSAEREQGITIDVAYRFFATEVRKFIVADAPGHEQYTRNMVTGASTAELAVILIDARRGVLTQTRRHAFLAARLGISRIVLAVNKMDLIGYDQQRFDAIVAEFSSFAEEISIGQVIAIPLSALTGDNVVSASQRLGWYRGPALLEYLESVEPRPDRADEPLRLPVQVVLRPDHSFRGFAGSIVRGQLRPGDPVRIQPAGTSSRIARLLGPAGELELAETGQAVTVTLTDEVDVSRGDLIASPARPAAVSDQFQVDLVWMSEQPLMPGRQYRFKHGTRSCLAVLSRPKYKIDVNTLNHIAATTLQLNDIAVCELSLDREIAFDPYDESRAMGSFLIIDRQTEDTLGAGMLRFALRRSSNVGWQSVAVDQPARAQLNGHRPCIIWLTGLSGAGKSTLANLIERQLHSLGVHSYLLDGDNLRHGLNHDLGFAEMDRVENVRRVGEVARLMVDAGLVVLVSLISPFRDDRDRARRLVEDGQFCEVFVDTPLAVAEARDPKGLYAKARSGALPNFTGIDSEYQPPLAPEVHVNTAEQAPEQSADLVIGWLRERGVLG